MNNVTRAFVFALGLVVLLAIGILAGRVGGIAIRDNFISGERLSLTVSNPAVRGTPVSVRWSTARQEGAGDTALMLYLRDQQSELVIGRATLSDGQALVEFPCTVPAAAGTIVVRRDGDAEVLGFEPVELLPPGRECAF